MSFYFEIAYKNHTKQCTKYTFSDIYSHTDIERETYLFFGIGHHFVFHLLFPSSTLCKTTFMTQFSLSFPDFDLNTFSDTSCAENYKMFLHSYNKLHIHLKYFLLPNQHYDYIFFTFLSTSGSCYNFLRGRKKVGHLSCLVSSAIRLCECVSVCL